MDVRVRPKRKLSTEELMLLNCGVGEDSWESLGLQGDPTSQSYRRSVLNIHWKDWCEAETLILWPPHAKSRLIGKDPDAGRDWGQEKGTIEDQMAGWHHRLNGHEFEKAPGVGDGQGSLTCGSPWGRKESDTTEWLNWTERLHETIISQWVAKSVTFIIHYTHTHTHTHTNISLERKDSKKEIEGRKRNRAWGGLLV